MDGASKFCLDDLIVDRARRQVRRDGCLVPLPALSFDTLWVLVCAAGEVVSFDELIEQAWNGAVVGNETVSQRVRLLRRALGDDARGPRYIESVRGRGYRLLAEPVPLADRKPPAWHRVAIAALVVGMLGGIGLEPSRRAAEPTDLVAVAPDAAALADRGWTYLGRHQQEDNRMARHLFTRALEADPQLATARAGLSLALSQAVTKFNARQSEALKAGEMARVLIEQRPELHLGYVALAASLDARGMVDPAIDAYEQALALAPESDGVRASLAYLYQVRGRLVEALELTLSAERGQPSLPYTDLQIADALRLLGFPGAAEPWLVRADRLKPDNVFAAQSRARHLLVQRRFDEAEVVLQQAVGRGVRRPELHELMAVIGVIRGDRRWARAELEEALAVDPQYGAARTWLAVIDRMSGRADGAAYEGLISEIERAIGDGDTWPTNFLMLADLHATAGSEGKAMDALQRLFASGFRDSRLLRVWPTLRSLQGQPAFEGLITRIDADVDRQRAEVIAAGWLPSNLLTADAASPAGRDR